MISKCLKIAVVQLAMLATLLVPVIEAVPQRRCLSSLIGLGCVCCRTTTAGLPSCCAKRLAQVEHKTCCRQGESAGATFSKSCLCKSRSGQPVSNERLIRPDVRSKHWVAVTGEVMPAIATASDSGACDHFFDSGQWAASGSLQSRLCRWLI